LCSELLLGDTHLPIGWSLDWETTAAIRSLAAERSWVNPLQLSTWEHIFQSLIRLLITTIAATVRAGGIRSGQHHPHDVEAWIFLVIERH
jgi:hypothetical protein